jgi:hypothetical protein
MTAVTAVIAMSLTSNDVIALAIMGLMLYILLDVLAFVAREHYAVYLLGYRILVLRAEAARLIAGEVPSAAEMRRARWDAARDTLRAHYGLVMFDAAAALLTLTFLWRVL